jgi:signal transduction histidine kinase
MRELIDRELRRARLAGGGSPGRCFRPHEDIPDLVAGIRTLYQDRSLEITTEIHAPERLPFDEEDMLELLGNLLDNAAKWARHCVHLGLHWGEDLRVLVEDDGPGVEPAAAKVLSARGSRLDESIPGHGLGLSIVQEVVRMHGGRIDLGRSERFGGFAARIELPAPRKHGHRV